MPDNIYRVAWEAVELRHGPLVRLAGGPDLLRVRGCVGGAVVGARGVVGGQ